MSDFAIDPETVKQASGILQRILNEEPEFWPYGLSVDQFDGGLYLLSKSASSKDYVGFVGWQEREEAGQTIGYYAIGVLPEYRRQGLAKAAVQKLLHEKAAGVDEVRAMVMSHNAPSQQLARSIPGVKLTIFEKLASLKEATFTGKQQALTALLGALGSTALFDQTADPEGRSIGSTFQPWTWDKKRQLMGAFNALLGAGGAHQMRAGIKNHNTAQTGAGITAILSAPAKDLMLKGQESLYGVDKLMAKAREVADRPSPASMVTKPMLYGALGLGAGALGLGAYASFAKARAAKAQAEAARGGRVKVTLPTKDPNDAETLLDIPIEEMNLSNALKARLSRDTRRKLYEETRKRTKHRNPKNPASPTDKEREDLQLRSEEQELDKAAAPQQLVPTPPGPGNPALRQTQQQATANSIDTSTAANPQIMKAQQDAADANMQASQQVAQAEQKTQQQLMDQQQGFNQQMQKVEQENQVLKMQIEKAKVESEVANAKVKAEKDLMKLKNDAMTSTGDAHNTQLHQLIGSRLKRVQQNVTKAATAGPWNIEVDTKRNPAQPWEIDAVTGRKAQGSDLDPTTGRPTPPPIQALRSDAAQQINDNGFEYMAQGRAPGIHLYNASYGGIGDMMRKFLLQPYLTTPPAANQDLSALGNLRRYGEQLLHQPQF